MKENNTHADSQQGVYTPEPRVYEVGYLLMPTVNEGDLTEERDALVAIITKHKGIVISEEQPQLIDLAYDMTKMINNKKHIYSQAYFGWIKFDVTPDVIDELTDEVEAIETIIRSLVIKTERDNTIVSERPYKLARVNKSDDEDEDDEDFGGAELVDEDDSDESTSDDSETTQSASSSISDDLTKIEGIGPKIAEVLNKKDIYTYADLSGSKVGDLRDYLAAADLSQHDPSTWKKQATLAKNGKWNELETLQAQLDGGRE